MNKRIITSLIVFCSACAQHLSGADCSLLVRAGAVLWTAREAGADVWAEAITQEDNSLSNHLLEVDFGWDFGLVASIGYQAPCSGWETELGYTWFSTVGRDEGSRGPGSMRSTFLGNFYVDNPTGEGLSGPSYEKAKIRWTIDFHIFDLLLGQQICIGERITARPFLGIKGGWIDQRILSTWINPELPEDKIFTIGTEAVKNDFWGLGPLLGIDTRWQLFCCGGHAFNLVADISGSLMWGHWSFDDLYHNDRGQEVTVSSENFNSGAPMVRTLMGFGWEGNCGCVTLSATLGYEMQFWLNQLQYYSFTGGRLDNQLTLQGGTLEFSIHF